MAFYRRISDNPNRIVIYSTLRALLQRSPPHSVTFERGQNIGQNIVYCVKIMEMQR